MSAVLMPCSRCSAPEVCVCWDLWLMLARVLAVQRGGLHPDAGGDLRSPAEERAVQHSMQQHAQQTLCARVASVSLLSVLQPASEGQTAGSSRHQPKRCALAVSLQPSQPLPGASTPHSASPVLQGGWREQRTHAPPSPAKSFHGQRCGRHWSDCPATGSPR